MSLGQKTCGWGEKAWLVLPKKTRFWAGGAGAGAGSAAPAPATACSCARAIVTLGANEIYRKCGHLPAHLLSMGLDRFKSRGMHLPKANPLPPPDLIYYLCFFCSPDMVRGRVSCPERRFRLPATAAIVPRCGRFFAISSCWVSVARTTFRETRPFVGHGATCAFYIRTSRGDDFCVWKPRG
ncbi:unnamed protein product, partial [Laminaria digitata]